MRIALSSIQGQTQAHATRFSGERWENVRNSLISRQVLNLTETVPLGNGQSLTRQQLLAAIQTAIGKIGVGEPRRQEIYSPEDEARRDKVMPEFTRERRHSKPNDSVKIEALYKDLGLSATSQTAVALVSVDPHFPDYKKVVISDEPGSDQALRLALRYLVKKALIAASPIQKWNMRIRCIDAGGIESAGRLADAWPGVQLTQLGQRLLKQ